MLWLLWLNTTPQACVYTAIFCSGIPVQDKFTDCTSSYRSISLVYFHWFGLARWEDESHVVGSIFWGETGPTGNGISVSFSLVEVQLIVYLLPACLSKTPYLHTFFNIKANNCIFKEFSQNSTKNLRKAMKMWIDTVALVHTSSHAGILLQV